MSAYLSNFPEEGAVVLFQILFSTHHWENLGSELISRKPCLIRKDLMKEMSPWEKGGPVQILRKKCAH